MAISPLDPNLKLLFGLDESGATSIRANAASGNVGLDYKLLATNQTTPEGLPVVDDDMGGKGVDVSRVPGTPWTTQYRALESQELALQDCLDDGTVQDPGDWTVDGEGFSLGMRLKFDLRTTGFGGSDVQKMFYFSAGEHDGRAHAGFFLRPDTNLSPSGGASLGMFTQASSYSGLQAVHGANGWLLVSGTVPDQADNYITDDGWYTVVCRQSYDLATNKHLTRAWIKNETTGLLLIFEKSTTLAGFAANSYTFPDQWRWSVGGVVGQPDMQPHYGYEDQAWYYAAALTDDEIERIIEDGIDIPWIAPDYEVLPSKVRVAVTNERAAFPPTRALPTGALAVDHPAGSYGTRPRLRYEGWEPNRPWSLRLAEMLWDSAGRRKGRTNNRFTWDEFDKALVRVPGRLAVGAMSDLRNVEFSGFGARRRRGFKIINDPEPTYMGAGANRFFSFRNTGDELFRCAKANATIYKDLGGGMASIDTGWASNELVTFVHFLDRATFLSPSRRARWDGSAAVYGIGEEAPDASTAPSLTTGTLVGTFYYAYTFYDPIRDEETAPYLIGGLAMAAEGALLAGLDTSPTAARFTQQRIYRTVAGGFAPDFFLTAAQNLATSYTDNGDADGTIDLDDVNGTYTTLVPPEDFSGGVVHAGRVFYWGGTNKDRVYRSEANTDGRYQADAYTAHSGPVRQVLSRGSQLVVITDRTVELVESDWARDTNGASFERVTTVSTTVGGAGHACGVDVNDQIYWLDRRGAYRLDGDTVVKFSPLIDNVFRRFNWGIGDTFVGSYNPLREQIIWTVASAEFTPDSSKRQLQLVWQIGTSKWTLYGLDAAACGQYDDDLNGLKYGCIDGGGVWKELESYDSDGVEEVGAEHTGVVTSAGPAAVTDSAQAWTVDEFRGYGVVLRNPVGGALSYHTVRTNTSDTLNVTPNLPVAVAADWQIYLGGIDAWFELAEVSMGSTNRKASRMLHTELDDLTRGDNL